MIFDFEKYKSDESVLIIPDENEIMLYLDAGKEPPKARITRIEVDKNGNQCFRIPNWRNPLHTRYEMFSNHIKDAVEEIRSGVGDRIETGELFQSVFQTRATRFRVFRYIDRTIGDALKSESISGWKDTRFGYSIVVYNPDSFNPPRFINKEFDYWNGSDGSDVLTFETEEDAENVVKDIVEKATCFGDWVQKVESDPMIDDETYEKEASKYPMIIRYGSDSGYIVDYERKYFGKNKNVDGYFIIRIIQDVKVD